MEIWLKKTSKLQITVEANCLAEEFSQLERREREGISHLRHFYMPFAPQRDWVGAIIPSSFK